MSDNRIAQVYRDAGVALEPGLATHIQQDFENCSNNASGSPLRYAYVPTGELAAAAYAGWLVNNTESLPAELAVEVPKDEDVAVQTFVNIANAAVHGVARSVAHQGEMFACAETEGNFGRTLRLIDQDNARSDSGNNEYSVQAQIVTDEQGPLILRKLIGSSTGLLLRGTEINGVPYAAGSLVGVCMKAEESVNPVDGAVSYNPMITRKSRQVAFRDTVAVVSVDQVAQLAFKRLTSFAYDVQDRDRIFVAGQSHARIHRVGQYVNISMEEIISIVDRAVPRYS